MPFSRAIRFFPPLLLTAAVVFVLALPSGAADPKPLSNSDIIALTTAHVPASVIVAKIQQAQADTFDVSTEAIVALSTGGVKPEVIEAMVKRVASREKSAAPEPTATPNPALRPVSLVIDGRPVVVEPLYGEPRAVGAVVTTLFYVDFPGVTPSLQETEPRPTHRIRSDLNPSAWYWLVTPEVDEKNNMRAVKMGSHRKGVNQPDHDWVVRSTVQRGPEGDWILRPSSDLPPGQYGLVTFGWIKGKENVYLFDFAVKGP